LLFENQLCFPSTVGSPDFCPFHRFFRKVPWNLVPTLQTRCSSLFTIPFFFFPPTVDNPAFLAPRQFVTTPPILFLFTEVSLPFPSHSLFEFFFSEFSALVMFPLPMAFFLLSTRPSHLPLSPSFPFQISVVFLPVPSQWQVFASLSVGTPTLLKNLWTLTPLFFFLTLTTFMFFPPPIRQSPFYLFDEEPPQPFLLFFLPLCFSLAPGAFFPSQAIPWAPHYCPQLSFWKLLAPLNVLFSS